MGAELEFILLKIDLSSCRKRSLFSYCSPRLLWSFPRLRVSCLYLTCIYPLINEIVLFYSIIRNYFWIAGHFEHLSEIILKFPC